MCKQAPGDSGDSGLSACLPISFVHSLAMGQNSLLEGFMMTDARQMVTQCFVGTAMTVDDLKNSVGLHERTTL